MTGTALQILLIFLCCTVIVFSQSMTRRERRNIESQISKELVIKVSKLEERISELEQKNSELRANSVSCTSDGPEMLRMVSMGLQDLKESMNLKPGLQAEKAARFNLEGSFNELKNAFQEQKETIEKQVLQNENLMKNFTDNLTERLQLLEDLIPGLKGCCISTTTQVPKTTTETVPLSTTSELTKSSTEENKEDSSLPRDCSVVTCSGIRHSGIYKVHPVYPEYPDRYDVYCDLQKHYGGWTVIQRRINGSVDFYRDWTDYENGFGQLNGEFWLGLNKIHRLTSQHLMELHISITTSNGVQKWARYGNFSISEPLHNYRLRIGSYVGTSTAVNRLIYMNGMMFSARDRDNDRGASNCAEDYKGAWWYKACADYSHLNGLYCTVSRSHKTHECMHWSSDYKLQASEMKVRPVNMGTKHPTCPPLTD